MIFLLVLLMLCSLAPSSSFDFTWDQNIMAKYAEMRVIGDCLGDSFIRSWRQTVKSSSEKCHGRIPDINQAAHLMKIFTKKPVEHIFSQLTNQHRQSSTSPIKDSSSSSNFLQSLSPGYKPVFLKPIGNRINYISNTINPHKQSFRNHFVHQQPQRFHLPSWGQPSNLLHQHRIWKRSVVDDKESRRSRQNQDIHYAGSKGDEFMQSMFVAETEPNLNLIKQRITDKISNMTCLLKHMELINDEGLPNYQHNLDLIQKLQVPQSLKDNFILGQEFCRDFSMCVPTEKMSSPLVSDIGKSIVFLKCLKKIVLEACMSHDLLHEKIEFLGMFGKSSIQEYLKEDYHHGSEDTINDLQKILHSDSEFGFGL